MSSIIFGIEGTSQLALDFDRIQEATDPDRLLDEVGAILLNRIRTRFLDETDPDGNKWPPSKAAEKRRAGGYTYRTVGGQRKAFTATGTLFETGALFHSIQLAKDKPTEHKIYTDVPYAKYLQEGTDKLPPRVFLGFGDEDVEVVTDLIKLRIERALRG